MNLNIGIDIAKNVHEACLVNENGEHIGKISKELNAEPRIGMEATGIYWYSLFSELSKKYKIHVYNPSQINGFASVNIRESKTDKIDAKTIATMLRFGESPKTNYSD